jgi:outer membrane receptor protein involved in Fe transport
MHSRFLLPCFLITAAVLNAAENTDNSPADSPPTVLDPMVVTGQLDQARDLILPDLGATSFLISDQQIENQPQGADAPFNQVLLRAPGVAEDSAANGDLHVRGEHANLQYRIDGVLLPEGITGFGLELDPRFVSGMQLITGSLPAEYGFRTAGIVDITTKNGSSGSSGDFSLYGGSYATLRPSFETAGSNGKLSYFADASYDQSDLGIENPTSSSSPIHDRTRQSKTFGYLSYVLDASSRISFMVSASYGDFQIPDTPGLPAGNLPSSGASGAVPWFSQMGITGFNSADLNENQNEQNYYGVATYQKSAGGLNLQVSAFGRDSGVHFVPDPVGDLYFNGVASDVNRTLYSTGGQGDASYELNDRHTLRGGALLLDESVDADSTTTLFPVDGNGNPTGPAFPIADRETLHGLFAGLYLQDEWTITSKLTVNYGGRFDLFDSSFDDEHQVSPRLNLIFSPTDSTALHAGYSRYFTPPPVENVPAGTVAEFNGTSNQSAVTQDDPVKAERSNYFDAGISQKLAPGFQIGLDAYYKQAQNQLDDGLFGQTLILSAFNYAKGEVYGQELTASYARGGFSSYANLAHSVAKGEDWNSAQFLFDPADLAYVKNHWIFLDHDQALTGSFGAAYRWKEAGGATRVYADAIYGTGLRTDATGPDGSNIPNGGTVPAHCVIGAGLEQSFKIGPNRSLKTRLDVVNLTDRSYELRDGTGVGVNAAQYGMRRGIFGSVGYSF